jgi:hypothetical protein
MQTFNGRTLPIGHPCALEVPVCFSEVSPGLQAALKQSFMPTSVRWLPHGLGYFLNLAFTTVRLPVLTPC